MILSANRVRAFQMARRQVLIVDDDKRAVDLVRMYLERDGYKVLAAYDGTTALEMARSGNVDLIVLDIMLPGISGLDICRLLRQESDVPIIMLTAKTLEEDKLLGFDLGADDYLTKPFSPRELLARIRSVLRRVGAREDEGEERVSVGSLSVDFRRQEVRVEGRLVKLTPAEFRILGVLIREPGRAFSRLQLLDKAFGQNFDGLERNVDIHVMHLRRKLGFTPEGPIKAVYGTGYKFEEA